MKGIIQRDRSIIPACDVALPQFQQIVRATHDIDAVGAYKISAALALSVGLPKLVELARKHTDKPLIYDHQKAATDIPDTATSFARAIKSAGISALILFPMSGPETQAAWINSCQESDLPVIVGAHMTHPRFLKSQGGYIDDDAVEKIYTLSAHHHVADYVVPGNKPDVIRNVRSLLEKAGVRPVFYAPGFITQGGQISDAAAEAGPTWHAIVGRAIYEQANIRAATLALTQAL